MTQLGMCTTRCVPSWNMPIFGAPGRPRIASRARRRKAAVAPEITGTSGNPWARANASSVVCAAGAMPGSPNLPGICGRALPQVEIRILDDAGRALPAGEVGEVCVAPATSGPFAGLYTPMLGYWKKPEETRDALQAGVLRTGDLGVLEADGTLFLRGRKKELILRGGANVYPAEVERVLHGDPRVRGAAVVGRPDERLGERVVAFVELVPGATVAADDLVARCRAELARYKVPEEIHFVEALPRTPMGKVRKPDLRELLAKEA